ncbi:hypothetical protein HG536_0F00880 [Torulaspora globosa]|uniref:Uncharacterized protein n=1 Tax=Torulaspora globosa TaxID=48254 RepID=A0A7G3ZJS7_9SACH|nr:uncharacterized protein HG536_0F00880 [Torulaspora globosa]QLL33763.1 hypothetical protein HG536_0F00880 [Torulaspora globosa]
MEEESTFYPDDFNLELADAVKKSWSEPQERCQSSTLFSPVGTPPAGSSAGSFVSSNNQGSLVTPPMTSNGVPDESCPGRNVERHYSLTENTHESISDIMVDLSLGDAQEATPESQLQPRPVRRGSIQDVHRVRHLLNPRSSFSGASTDEPTVPREENVGWVTILADDRPETMKPIIILDRSLQAVKSKYRLHVLHDRQTNAAELAACGIKTVCFDETLPKSFRCAIGSSSVLSLFVVLVDRLELACYLAPTCMVMENVDELLESEEICDEIDNETCVLLTKESSEGEAKNCLQIMILRPCNDLAMCVKELFTVYGDHGEERKVSYKDDFDVLRTLFDHTWGHLSSDEYCTTPNFQQFTDKQYKIVDYRLLKPWIESEESATNSLCERWRLAWQDFELSWRDSSL